MSAPTETAARNAAGAFTWNAGGWFGTQVGSSCWLAVAGIVLAPQDLGAAAGAWAAFIVANGAGTAIWAARQRLTAFRGMMLLVLILGVTALAAMTWIDLRGALPLLGPTARGGPALLYGMLLIYPALGVLFWSRERAAKESLGE